jgi:hypothetical protein
MSLPIWPERVSLPPRPESRSFPDSPDTVSAFAVPVRTRGFVSTTLRIVMVKDLVNSPP